MTQISIQEIERDLSGYLRRVEGGETILVFRDQHAVAEIKPVPLSATEPRPFGLCAGQFAVPADFDQPLPEDILKEFEGR